MYENDDDEDDESDTYGGVNDPPSSRERVKMLKLLESRPKLSELDILDVKFFHRSKLSGSLGSTAMITSAQDSHYKKRYLNYKLFST